MQLASTLYTRDQSSFPYSKEIAKPFGKIDEILTWCRQELVDDWRWQLMEPSSDIRQGRYLFYFDSERDCCAFVLQWA